MDTNEGTFDRTLRIAVGLALIASPLGVYGFEQAYAWGWLGLIPLVTGLTGFCPVYKLIGIRAAST